MSDSLRPTLTVDALLAVTSTRMSDNPKAPVEITMVYRDQPQESQFNGFGGSIAPDPTWVKVLAWPSDAGFTSLRDRVASGAIAKGSVVHVTGTPSIKVDVLPASEKYPNPKTFINFMIGHAVVRTLDELEASRSAQAASTK